MTEKIKQLKKNMTGKISLGGGNERSRYKKGTNRIKSNGSTPFSEQVELEV